MMFRSWILVLFGVFLGGLLFSTTIAAASSQLPNSLHFFPSQQELKTFSEKTLIVPQKIATPFYIYGSNLVWEARWRVKEAVTNLKTKAGLEQKTGSCRDLAIANPVKTAPKKVDLEPTGSKFQEIAEDLGIHMPAPGGGVGWLDYDSDGNLDLFVTTWTSCGRNTLYRNNGNGTFTDVSEEAKIPRDLINEGVATADYNNDGYPDIYIVRGWGGEIGKLDRDKPNILLKNNGDGTFTDVSEEAGVADKGVGKGAAWGDYNKDGFLDLYVANIGTPKSKVYVSQKNTLFKNNGDGTFTDVTDVAGVGDVAVIEKHGGTPRERSGLSMQPHWFDYNNDGWLDVYVTADNGVSPLFKNNGDGTFTDVTKDAKVNLRGTGMGVAIGDYDNDGDLDIYLTNDGPNYLFQNQGNGTFQEVALSARVANTGTGWATGFIDYDNDGDLDLYVVNGAVVEKFFEGETSRRVNNTDAFYENLGDGTFRKVSESVGVFDEEHNMAGAQADYNNDGFVDIFTVGSKVAEDFPGGMNLLYRNTGNNNNWVTIKLRGTKSNRDGIGARIKVKTKNKTQVQEVASGSSYNSQGSLWLTFGLGKETVIDEVEVRWPSGKVQTLEGVGVNQQITIVEE